MGAPIGNKNAAGPHKNRSGYKTRSERGLGTRGSLQGAIMKKHGKTHFMTTSSGTKFYGKYVKMGKKKFKSSQVRGMKRIG